MFNYKSRVTDRADYDLENSIISDSSNVQTTLRRFRDDHAARWELITFFNNIEQYTWSKALHRIGVILVRWILSNESLESLSYIKYNHVVNFQISFQEKRDLLNNIPENIFDSYSELFWYVNDDKKSKILFLNITIENFLKYLERSEYFSIDWEFSMEIEREKNIRREDVYDAMGRMHPH